MPESWDAVPDYAGMEPALVVLLVIVTGIAALISAVMTGP